MAEAVVWGSHSVAGQVEDTASAVGGLRDRPNQGSPENTETRLRLTTRGGRCSFTTSCANTRRGKRVGTIFNAFWQRKIRGAGTPG